MNDIVLGTIYKSLLDLLVLVLIPAIISTAFALVKSELLKHKVMQNGMVDWAVTTAVQTVEQEYQAGKLKGIEKASQDKFEEALDISQSWLTAHGIPVEMHDLGTRIEAAVFSEITKQVKPFLTDVLSVPAQEASAVTPPAPKA